MKVKLRGAMTQAMNTPNSIQASRHPTVLINVCATGIPITVPPAIPAVTMDMARPRRRVNHFATGTVVTRLPPGPPPSPKAPEMPKTKKIIHSWLDEPRTIRLAPATSPPTTPSQREPKRSIVRPTKGEVTAETNRRKVSAHARVPRLYPRSVAMGAIKKEKITGLRAVVATFIMSEVATMTHP